MASPAPASLTSWLDTLLCPQCGQALALSERTLRCPDRHSFDLARSGYLPLLSGAAATSGDDDDMARARDRFLATGAYAPVRELITDLLPPGVRSVLDVGCGTGYYLAGVLDSRPTARGLGMDTSVRALRFAARSHPRAAAASWDVFAPFPLRDHSIDLVLDVFAPRNPAEFARVLAPGGHLLVVRPRADHLAELRASVPGMVQLDPHKEARLHEVLDPLFTTEDTRELEVRIDLTAQSARDLIAMTPSARHVSAEALEGLVEDVPSVTVSVVASLHRRR